MDFRPDIPRDPERRALTGARRLDACFASGPVHLENPALVWLECHGAAHGFEPDSSHYEFGDFIAEKAQQFEKLLAEMALRGSQHLSGESMDSVTHASSSLGGVRSR